MCKMCLFEDGGKKQKIYKMRTKICGLCNSAINNYAENRSLMNLICTYTDNKHLIEKEDDEVQEEDEKATRAVDHLKLRCDILEKEKRNTATMLAK